MKQTDHPKVGERYLMGYSFPTVERRWPTFSLYTGLQDGSGGKEHEFICTPTYMDIPNKDFLLTRRFPEGQLVMGIREVLLDKSEWRNVTIEPETPEHKRLNEILVEYYGDHSLKLLLSKKLSA